MTKETDINMVQNLPTLNRDAYYWR